MRRELRAVGPLLLVTTIALLMVPAAHAYTPWKVGSGYADMSITDVGMKIWGGRNIMMLHVWGGGGYLYGTFEGKWIHNEWDVIDLTAGTIVVFGVWDTPDGVTVENVKGTVHVCYWATQDAVTYAFQGNWVIISGTGGLANLRGQGTIWATATDMQSGIMWYTVNYHFDP